MTMIGPIIIAVLIIIFLIVFFTLVPVGLWISALSARVPVGLGTLIGMRLRRVVPSRVVKPLIKAVKAGLDLEVNQLESHYLAGGDVDNTVDALIAAHRANIELDFSRAAAIDLAGRDVLEAVQTSVTPKVIRTPEFTGVAQNGVEVKVITQITVQSNIERIVGGAGEDTVIVRVGEAVVSTVGETREHTDVLENPNSISKKVQEQGLGDGTAYTILSIDIAEMRIGDNIKAKLDIEKANADMEVAQAAASKRKAEAIALEQENRAAVVAAEAEVPRALSRALEEGNLGVMDYYKMENVQSDTAMRESIAHEDEK
ncbi:TPA: flotillin-like protein FloA [Listeria monocytogenes]